jgi:hypothetical protein
MNENTDPESICAPEFGAEPLADSGFEDEEPDPAFDSASTQTVHEERP